MQTLVPIDSIKRVAWNKGRKLPPHTLEWKKNMSDRLKGKLPKNFYDMREKGWETSKKGELNGVWKGDEVSYRGLHQWVVRELGKPTKCEFCGKDGLTGHKIHWASKSREYLRDLSDWIRLCVKCHMKYDRKNNI